MQTFYLDPIDGVHLRCRMWRPEGAPSAIVQIIHGVAEHIDRYDEFAQFLNAHGFLVVGEDHPGHGFSETTDGIQGYLTGGWNGTVDCIHALHRHIETMYPGTPYFMLGHSMGSFLLRSYLFDGRCHIRGAVLSGTGWQPGALLAAGRAVCTIEARRLGQQGVSSILNTLMFGGYNKKFSPNRTSHDWLCSDEAVVDRYVDDPCCGFPVTVQLCREMFFGLSQIQNMTNLRKMNTSVPVLFAAGTDDPVGNMGKGVLQTAHAFQKCRMQDVTANLYPAMRHEILNEKSKIKVFNDIYHWISSKI